MSSNLERYENSKFNRLNKPKEITIIPNDSLWAEKLKNYQKSKDIFYFNTKDFPKIITKEMVRSSEGKFNPITQKYIDSKKDNMVSKSTNQRRLNLISNGYDKQLEEENTYNIINLSNKLKSLHYEEPSVKTSPNKNLSRDKTKQNQFNYETLNKKPYNILTNISLKDHNFLPPKLRNINNDKDIKNCKEGLSEFDKKNKKINEMEKYKRDFNIINNEYKIFNREKKETEKEIQNLNAMKKMQNRKTYDILNCKYINPSLENEFVKNMEIKKNLLLSKTKDKNYIIRNPINNTVYDKEAQKRLDDIEREKKRRYILHENVENYYHSLGNNKDINKNEMMLSHGNPLDLNYKNKRGYDILKGTNFIQDKINSQNSTNFLDVNMSQKKAGQYFDNWEKIKLKADSNNTISSKPIYKEPYDYSDVEKNFEKFLQNKKTTIMNSKNILRSYGTFNNATEQSSNLRKNSYGFSRRNNFTAGEYVTRTNNEGFRKSNSGIMNTLIDNRFQSDKMDKNKFFGISKNK